MSGSLLNDALEKFFIDQFHTQATSDPATTATSAFAFEQFPLGLTSEQFFAREGDVKSFSRPAVNEYFSISMADLPSSIVDGYRRPVLSPISDTYFFELLGPSTFWQDTLSSDEANLDAMSWYNTVKAEGKKRFERLKLASTTGLAVDHPSTDSLPPNWLDPGGGTWTRHQLAVSQTATSTPPAATTSAPTGQVRDHRFMMMKRDIAAPEPIDKPLLMFRKITETSPAATIGEAAMKTATPSTTFTVESAKAAQPITRPIALQMTKFAPLSANRAVDLPNLMKFRRDGVDKSWMHLADQIEWQQQIVAMPPPTVQEPIAPVETTGMTVEFSFQIVQIRRQWLFTPFLFNANWFVQGLRRGEIADFTGDGDSRMSWIPSAIILVKDVTLRASWSNQDQAQIAQSFAVGPFLLGDKKTVSNESLTIPGIQWIASVSQALPKLPPHDDPALPSLAPLPAPT